MAIEIKLPELGENLAGGEILEVKVTSGQMVTEGQPLLEVQAEKATFEVPSPVAGQVARLMVKKGEAIKVGQTLCLIEGGGDRKPEPPRAASAPAAKPGPAPDRTTASRPALEPSRPAAPDKIPVPSAREATDQPSPSEKQETDRPQAEQPEATQAGNDRLVPAGPATRRLARELGIDLARVAGTASGGRVTQEDVKAFVRQLASGGGGRLAAAPGPALPDFSKWGPIDRQTLEPIRRKTAEQMSLAWSLIPHVTQQDLADITDLDHFRRQQDSQGPRLTVTAFALKATVIALRQFPRFNSSLDSQAGQLILKQYYHLGVAVDTDRGLLVPVLRDVDRKSVQQLAQELADLAARAREKKIQADQLRGGTFTITNLGGIGGTGFSPIVNYPEVAILGLARARWQPVVRDQQVVPRLLLPLSLSYDHRVIDGADAARFARRVADLLENPLLMLVHA